MKKKLSLLSLLPLIFLTFSCAHNAGSVKTSYDILAASQLSYDMAMKVLVDLDIHGHLLPDRKSSLLKSAHTYYIQHNNAVATLARYEETKDLKDRKLLAAQLTIASDALISFLNSLKPYLGETHE